MNKHNLPSDWTLKRVQDVCDVNSESISESTPPDANFFYQDLSTVNNGRLTKQTAMISYSDAPSRARRLAKLGDVVMSTVRPYLKGFAQIDFDPSASVFSTGFAILRPHALDDQAYVFQSLLSGYFDYQYHSFLVGSNYPALNSSDVKALKIPFPDSPKERQKIAEILGACDEAIKAHERLIAQKQQRKKGLMQKLLTGEVRFPEFAGTPWREVWLGDVGSVTGAGVDKKSNPEEVPVRLVNYMDVYRNPFITNGLLAHTVTAPEKKAKQCSTKKGDVFFTPSSEKPTDIANSAVALEDIPDAVYSYHVVRLRLKEDWDLRFRAYAFTTDEFMRQAERICEGSGTRYVISLEDFRNIKVSVPSKEEQSAISSVLSACDEEITLQQTKLEQLKQQKKGLMQQLLTGKVRVKV